MNYEIAKQLKDAGFDQEYLPGCFDAGVFSDKTYSPTLSELIEACGSPFDSLSKGTKPIDHPWTVNAVIVESWKPRMVYFHGETPEEAVAKLWIHLNNSN